MSANKISKFLMRGIITVAPVTPFRNGNINLPIIKDYVKFLRTFAVDNVFVTGTTGEGNSMSVQERNDVVQAWVDEAKDNLGIMVQVGAGGLRDSQTLARFAQDVGADAIACVAPTYYKPATVDAYVGYMQQVAAAAPRLPFYLYDIDFITGVKIDVKQFFRAAQHRIPTLRGVKHTSISVPNMSSLLGEFGDRYQVMVGGDDQFLAALAIGVEVGVFQSYNSRALRRLHAAFTAGDLATARMEQNRTIAVSKTLCDLGFGIASGTKAMLTVMGLDVGQPRLPCEQIGADSLQALRTQLNNIGFFEWGTQE